MHRQTLPKMNTELSVQALTGLPSGAAEWCNPGEREEGGKREGGREGGKEGEREGGRKGGRERRDAKFSGQIQQPTCSTMSM